MRISYVLPAALLVISTAVADVEEQKENKVQRITFSNSAISDSINAEGKNYPNPFWATSVVSFTIEKDDSVKVELFDIKGASQGVVLDSFLYAGSHKVNLKADNLPSGVYFIRISASGTSAILKMTLLK